MDEWFPTAAYSVSLGKVQTALSYSIKTDRPSFFAMNDAVTYISRYTLQAGNSQLLNERLRELTLNLSYRWLTLTASYERTASASWHRKVCSKTARSPSVVPSSTACSITASTSRATWATTSSARPTDTPPTNSTSRSPTALTPLAANTREQVQARRHRRE